MITNKSITIAIPTFNSEAFILQTIESIFNQSYPINEIIIVDDNSGDETINVIKNSSLYNKESIKITKNLTNLGYAKNWNNCLKYCQTEFLLILHHDDLLKPDAIEKQLHFYNINQEIALVGGQEDTIDENGNRISSKKPTITNVFEKGQILEFVKQTGSYIPCSTVMFNLEKIKQVGFFDEKYLATDELFWPKVLTKFPIAVMGESLINRRIHLGQAENSDFAKKYDKIIEASIAQYQIAFYEKETNRHKATLKLLKEKSARNCIRISLKVFQMERGITTSIKYLKFAFKEYPKIFFTKFFIKFAIKAVLGKIH